VNQLSVPSESVIAGARSFLFAPGDDARKLASADRTGADVVVADLEDAVAGGQKHAARREVERFATERRGGPALLVRVNSQDSEFFHDDLACVRGLPVAGVVVPKARVDGLAGIDFGEHPVVAMIEDAAGVRDAYDIGSVDRVVRLALGAVDLAAQLGLRHRADGLHLLGIRSRLVVDSAAAGLEPPIDTPYLRYSDDDGLRNECDLSRSLGFTAKACIHPRQVPIVRSSFMPTREELEWATRVVEAFEQSSRLGHGVASFEGLMIDAPVVARARAFLDLANETESGHAP
jgi:citrate lyase subunit beta/citryl-CoA lyase